jgi:hypothetical protein
MASKLRLKYVFPNTARGRFRTVARGQTVQQGISFITRMDGADIDRVTLDDCQLAPDVLFDNFYNSPD